MGLIHIMSRGGDEEYRFKAALKKAKSSIEEICELSEQMEEEFSERNGYGERSGYRMRSGYSRRDDWDSMDERRSSDSRGRYM